MKKRILSLVLCAAMLLSMAVLMGAGNAADTTESASTLQAVNFTNVAPFVQANAQAANGPARAPMFAANANGGSTTPTDPAKDKDTAGLVTTKTAEALGDDKYKITLTSYTTGTVTEQTTTKPTDIVLVLDQSGSMKDAMGSEQVTVYTKVESRNIANYRNQDNRYVKLSNGAYAPVTITESKSGGWFDTTYTYTYTYTDENGQQRSMTSEGQYTTFDKWPLYSQETRALSRLEALKNAVTNFVDQVSKEATENKVNHRIAIVGFSSNDYDDGGTDFKNTEILTGCTVNNNNNGVQYVAKPSSGTSDAYKDYIAACGTALVTPQSAKAAINYLEANGGTETDKGMQMAKDILDNDSKKDEDRNRVVVLFTDGVPLIYSSSGSGADNDNIITERANRAINTANSICGNATVYTVGVFSGANGDISKGLPRNDGSWENDTNKPNRFMHLVSSNYPDATAMDATGEKNSSLKNDDSYYLSAGDAATLNSIFEKISNNISTPSIKLGTQAYVQDKVSDYFTAPAGGNVTVTTEKAYYENGNLQWKTDDNPPAGLTHTVTDKTVKVSGFDYDSNFVSDKGRDENDQKKPGKFYGRRLVVTFTVKAEPGFLGGNNVPTNDATSGVYDEKGTLVENFDYPRVNVPINTPTLDPKDANVYYGGDVPKAEALCTTGAIGEKMADYVDITYSVDGTTVSNTTDATYQVTMTVSPKYSGDNAKGTPATEKTAFVSSTVNVYKPEVTFKDCTTNYGVLPEYSTANFVNAEWKNSSGTSASVAEMTGEKPKLTYAYAPVDKSFTKDTYVNVTVTSNKDTDTTKISGAVTFKHDKCDFPGCSFDREQGQFIVHINVFDLTIVKAAADDRKPIDPHQTFVFKVTNKDTGKTMEVVITGEAQQTIKNLPVGDYTITEDTSWSWKYTPVGSTEKTLMTSGIRNGDATVTFKNENNGTNWLTSLAQVINTWATGKAELKK